MFAYFLDLNIYKNNSITKITKRGYKNKHKIVPEIFWRRKDKIRGYRRNRYKDVSKKDRQKLKEYRKMDRSARIMC